MALYDGVGEGRRLAVFAWMPFQPLDGDMQYQYFSPSYFLAYCIMITVAISLGFLGLGAVKSSTTGTQYKYDVP